MRVLVTGISGFLGYYFIQYAPKAWRVSGTYLHHQPFKDSLFFKEIDLQNISKVRKFIKKVKPDAIVHTAAISKPAQCESNPDASYRLNVVTPTYLALAAREMKVPFVFTSTDLVFDGENAPYLPDSPTSPVNLYGKQKKEAERRVLDIYPDATIVRLPLLYGISLQGKNFLTEWQSKLQQGETVNAFTDEFRSTAHAKDIITGVQLLIDQQLSGIWHLGGPESLSRYQMAILLAQQLKVDEKLVHSSQQKELALLPKRPANVTLDSEASYQMGFKAHPMKAVLQQIIPTN
ncbi:MAG: SDR family oxidoreductase [Bacteroidota bacterium]